MSGFRTSTAQIQAESWKHFETAVPPTPVEAAIAAAGWERRGLLGRLVRTN